mgnify:CR=1 FL=1
MEKILSISVAAYNVASTLKETILLLNLAY